MKKHLILIFILLLSSCSSGIVDIFPEFETAEITHIADLFLKMPIEMQLQDGNLYISDYKSDSLLHCYDIKTGNRIRDYIPFGDGPGEYLSPLQFIMDDSIFVAHNRWHYSARFYKPISPDVELVELSDMIHLPNNIDRICLIKDTIILASGLFEEGRFAIIDCHGNMMKVTGDYPNYAKNEFQRSNIAKSLYHQSLLKYNKDKNILVSVTGHVLETWSYANDSLSLVVRHMISPYDYSYYESEDWKTVKSTGNTISGVYDLALSDKFIYLLHNSNKVDEDDDNCKSEILIYSYDGKPIKKIVTDTNVEIFTVTGDDGVIYCVFNGPDLSIGKILL